MAYIGTVNGALKFQGKKRTTYRRQGNRRIFNIDSCTSVYMYADVWRLFAIDKANGNSNTFSINRTCFLY